MTTTTPRQAVGALLARPRLPQGDDERFTGYGVMGIPFASGHYLALRDMVASSVGPAYRSIWHRDPQGLWTMHTTGAPELTCPRYFGSAAAAARVPGIDVSWRDGHVLDVALGDELSWRIELAATPATRMMTVMGGALPEAGWNSNTVLASMGPMARAMLRSGKVKLRGATPNDPRFKAAPLQIWRVVGGSASYRGEDLGDLAPLAEQAPAAPRRGARRALGRDRPRAGSAGRAHAPVRGHRVQPGGPPRSQPGAAGHGLLHDADHVDRLSRGLAGVRPLVRRRHRGPPRRVPGRLVRAAVPALPHGQRRARRATGSAGPGDGHAAPGRARPARDHDPLPLHLGRRPRPPPRPRPGGRADARLHLRAVRRGRAAGGCLRRGDPDRDAGGPARRRGRGARADVRRAGGGRDGPEPAWRPPGPDRRRRLHHRCGGALPGPRRRPVGPGAGDRPRPRYAGRATCTTSGGSVCPTRSGRSRRS